MEQNNDVINEEKENLEDLIDSDHVDDFEDLIETPEERLKKEIKLNKKLIIIIMSFVICSLLYLFSISTRNYQILHSGNSLVESEASSSLAAITYLKYVMYITHIISFVGLIIFILLLSGVKISISYEKKCRLYAILDWVVLLPICLVITTMCFSFFFSIAEVDGTSMAPNLSHGEKLFINYNKKLEREDIVIIYVDETKYYSIDHTRLFVKRIIALPGDIIKTDGKNMWINNEKVEPSYQLLTQSFAGSGSFNYLDNKITHNFCFITEVQDKVKTKKICDHGETNNEFIIPEGYYLVLGDNRDNSTDSRKIGLIEEIDILGVATRKMNNLFDSDKL